MKKAIFLVVAVAAVSALARDVSDFCDGWEFSRDQKTWREVDIPHDWAVEGPFDPEGDTDTGKLPWKGVGYYRKQIVLGSAPKDRRIFLDFEGVMCDGTVYVNGQSCVNQPYGYLGMRADATAYLFEGTNTILVKADTANLYSRWYPGAGMYRRVRKIETGYAYVDDRDVFVTASPAEGGEWNVSVKGVLTNLRPVGCTRVVDIAVKSPGGEVVASGRAAGERHGAVVAEPCGKCGFEAVVKVRNPELWDMKPNAPLYTVEIRLTDPFSSVRRAGDGDVELAVKTGFRTFSFKSSRGNDPAFRNHCGFLLNGRRVQLKGACLHSDLGILGMAFNRSAMRRELLALMDMGVNAIRTSHNPPSPELLDLCDELGLFVWDECFDKWNSTSGRGSIPLEKYVSERLAEFVRRDRNHPCVFVWSIGNEISPGKACPPGQEHWAGEFSNGTTLERCTLFREVVRSLDLTRPVGIGSCFPEAAPKGDYATLDITGWNYGERYGEMRRLYPDKPIIYSESASALSDFGHYSAELPKDKRDYDVSNLGVDSYDRNAAPWSDIPDHEFERMERDIFVAGEFVWTGVDYLGEPTPYARNPINGRAKVPRRELARSSYFGVYDLLVLPKDRVWLYRSHWNEDAFTLHIVPAHWNFSKASLPVYVYTSAGEAELFLNGKSLGRRKKDPNATFKNGYYAVLPRYRLVWDDVKYEPGELKVVAYGEDGKILGEESVRTAGEAAAVSLKAESSVLPADTREFVFVEVGLKDSAGVRVHCDNRRVSFAVEGPAKIVSVGNSNPRGLDSFKEVSSHPLYYGRAGLFLRRTGAGEVKLTASAPGLASAVVRFAP